MAVEAELLLDPLRKHLLPQTASKQRLLGGSQRHQREHVADGDDLSQRRCYSYARHCSTSTTGVVAASDVSASCVVDPLSD